MTSTPDPAAEIPAAEAPAAESAAAEAPAAETPGAEAPAVEAAEETPAIDDPAAAEPLEEVAAPDLAPLVADEVLLGSRDLARTALAEITDAQTIGADDGHEINEAHVLTLFFECRLPGYPGWRWAASLARADESAEPTVLEVELLPGAGAVVAPEWVPWSERLAQYREAQKQAAESAAGDEDETDDAEPGELEDEAVDPALDAFDDDAEDAADGDDIDDEDEDALDTDPVGLADETDLDDEDAEVDEDGFAALDEHDLRDLHGHDEDELLDGEEEE